jgi:hypothetical protein
MNQPASGSFTNSQNLCQPGTAFALGLIPGVGALCNGEYLRAFVHVMIFGFLISIANTPGLDTFQPMFILLAVAFYFYMPLEAYHTARRRLFEAKGLLVATEVRNRKMETLWTGVVLILMGGLLFVDHIVHGFLEQAFRFWPLALIGFGFVKLAKHFKKEKG